MAALCPGLKGALRPQEAGADLGSLGRHSWGPHPSGGAPAVRGARGTTQGAGRDRGGGRDGGRALAARAEAEAQVQTRGPQAEENSCGGSGAAPSFPAHLKSHGFDPVLRRRELSTLQINVGLYCNQACAHCHVDSSPLRTEMMDQPTAARILDLLAASPGITTVDLTGGAPELNPQFRFLVEGATRLGKAVIDRCNLTVLFEPGQENLGEFLKLHKARIVASLPCYSAENVDKQRGGGVFDKSIRALQLLNSLGYGQEGSGLALDLVYNPVGATLPPSQGALEPAYKSELESCYGIKFNSLLTITNMPINRFKADLERKKTLEGYMQLLASSFNPAAVPGIMCTNLISIRWDGAIFDCDFNQQLDMPAPVSGPDAPTVFSIGSFDDLLGAPVALGSHCFGCTAGQGSSCTGAVI